MTDNVFSSARDQGEFDTWTCDQDPWITPAVYPGESGWPSRYTCQLAWQRDAQDWQSDTMPPSPFSSAMCFNHPWGASLAGYWSTDDLSVDGPSATILQAGKHAPLRRLP